MIKILLKLQIILIFSLVFGQSYAQIKNAKIEALNNDLYEQNPIINLQLNVGNNIFGRKISF